MKYMLLEDDPTIALALDRYFSKRGVELRVFTSLKEVYDEELAEYDLLILDAQPPDG